MFFPYEYRHRGGLVDRNSTFRQNQKRRPKPAPNSNPNPNPIHDALRARARSRLEAKPFSIPFSIGDLLPHVLL